MDGVVVGMSLGWLQEATQVHRARYTKVALCKRFYGICDGPRITVPAHPKNMLSYGKHSG
jgi:hypothetical protein